ncbi:VWA domain-containing protein [Pseudalkalibacillus caeni]|uniref:VWA domain-containing protein n=1 Tax=Exobacillus caeni TaxID=2574798 RepID=A0A5R9FBH8_9BACL|nr:VWA domain-containing protein [Pseudalkalibacillus caeni]TLS38243.1 VWA domain-containing protein [Pseudalkalibacillus caeni]
MAFQFDNPYWLLLFLPGLVGIVLYALRIQRPINYEQRSLLGVRTFIVICLVTAIAGLQVMVPQQGVSTVFVVDRSDSVSKQENEMVLKLKEAVKSKQEDDQFAVIAAGKNAEVELSLQKETRAISGFHTIVEPGHTGLSNGLRLGGSLLSAGDRGRVVLLSDGNETTGNAVQQAGFLKQQGIRVDVLPVEPRYGEDVAVETAEISPSLYVGETASLTVIVKSNIEANSRIRVYEDNRIIGDQRVEVRKGSNEYAFEVNVEEPGFHQYRAEILSDKDTITENNETFTISEVKGTPRVLVVEGTGGEGANLTTALKSTEMQVETIQPELLPTNLAAYLQYKTIVFANVSATKVTQKQMDLIHSAVKDFGTGFIMTGGDNSFGLGGYFKTPIEKVLPVEMDLKGKKELPSLGMVIVLDRSGSMSGYKLQLAKEAAARSVELLRDKDTLGFIAFDDRPWQIIDTKPIANKKKAMGKVRSITAGGGTEIFTSLDLAYQQLKPLKLQRKHIILLTDGQSATNSDYLTTIENGKEDNITLSTVAIGSDADGILLEELAGAGGGRYYDVQDASTIPSILSRETVLTTRTYIENDPFYPKVIQGNEWQHHFAEGMPEMNAYVATTPKSRAETALVSGKEDPILTSWQYGLGRSIAWSSDLKGEWSGEWPSWDNWATFWNDLVTWTFPKYENQVYEIEKNIEGDQVKILIDSKGKSSLPLKATIVDNNGREQEPKVKATAPGKYEVDFTGSPGVYSVQLSEMSGDNVTSMFKTGIAVPYSDEYRIKPVNTQKLREIAEAGGGVVLSSPEQAFERNLANSYLVQSISHWLLFLAFALFFLDVAIRRFGFAPLSRFVDRKEQKLKEESTRQKQKSTAMQQLKHASKTRTKREKKPGDENSIENKPVQQKQRVTEKMTEQPVRKVSQKKKTSELSKEERMNRLLNAKNKRKL